MNERFRGSTVLVTGGSRGIGRAVALSFGKEGAKVCVNYQESKDAAEKVCQEIRGLGTEALSAKADVADAGQVKQMVRKVVDEFKQIDVLVNNAGVLFRGDTFVLDDTKLERMFEVNVRGVLSCTREVAPLMTTKRAGSIINIASIAALGTTAMGTTQYSMTKAAIVTLTKRLALELGEYGIRVNCIAPGFIETDLNRGGRTEEEFGKIVKSYIDKTMLRRIGTPDEIATVALFLASKEASFVTGQTITVDGGRTDLLTYSS
jgi:3-oxoacyl-[acyl-carrier protein] reductase